MIILRQFKVMRLEIHKKKKHPVFVLNMCAYMRQRDREGTSWLLDLLPKQTKII